MNTSLEYEFTLALCTRMSLYAPAHVVRCFACESPRCIARGTNMTLFGITVAIARSISPTRSWYRAATRSYVHELCVSKSRGFYISMYICMGIQHLSTLAQRTTFLDLCICALREHTPERVGIPQLPMGATAESLSELRNYIITVTSRDR